MKYANNQFKWVAVLNKKTPIPQLLNALGHLAVGSATTGVDEPAGFFHTYVVADGSDVARISNWPVIILKADNGNQLRTLRTKALDAGLKCQAFLDTMLGASADDQLHKTRTTEMEKVDFFAVMLFGNADELDALTKKFSLFSRPAVVSPQPFHTLDPH